MLHVVVSRDTHHIRYFGVGRAFPAPDETVIYREGTDEVQFHAELEALPGWAGDARMAVVDARGVPVRVAPRPLTPAEQGAEALAEAMRRQRAALAQAARADVGAIVTDAGAAGTVEALREQVVALAQLVGWLVEVVVRPMESPDGAHEQGHE